MIPWTNFENEIKTYLSGHRAKSEKDLAKFISDKYDSFIKLGKTQYQNGVASANKSLLENHVYTALLDARRNVPLTEVSRKISAGIVLYWTSVKMQIFIPPPGAISVVTNVVVFPGTPINFSIVNTADSSVLAKSLINSFRVHSLSIKGINTALIPVPAGTVPTPFPWSGLS